MYEKHDKVALVAHCIVNQSTRVWGRDGSARRDRGMMSDVVRALLRLGVGVIQMECPEFSLYGNPRPLRSKDGYDTPEFRRRCREVAAGACSTIADILSKGVEPKVRVVGILGVENSPSCGVGRVTRTVGVRPSASRGGAYLWTRWRRR